MIVFGAQFQSPVSPININPTTLDAGGANSQKTIPALYGFSDTSNFAAAEGCWLSDPKVVNKGPYARRLVASVDGWIIIDTPYETKIPVYLYAGVVCDDFLVECFYDYRTTVTGVRGYTGAATCTDVKVIP